MQPIRGGCVAYIGGGVQPIREGGGGTMRRRGGVRTSGCEGRTLSDGEGGVKRVMIIKSLIIYYTKVFFYPFILYKDYAINIIYYRTNEDFRTRNHQQQIMLWFLKSCTYIVKV